MVARFDGQERSELPLLGACERPHPPLPHEDNPATVTIHREDRDPQDGQPRYQELLISDACADVLLKLGPDGELTLRHVGHYSLTTLHLSASIARAMIYAAYDWLYEVERWQEALTLTSQYHDGLLSYTEFCRQLEALHGQSSEMLKQRDD